MAKLEGRFSGRGLPGCPSTQANKTIVDVGVYLFPHISKAFGLSGALEFAAGMALVGTMMTFVIPETAQRSLEAISDEDGVVAEAERILANHQTASIPELPHT